MWISFKVRPIEETQKICHLVKYRIWFICFWRIRLFFVNMLKLKSWKSRSILKAISYKISNLWINLKINRTGQRNFNWFSMQRSIWNKSLHVPLNHNALYIKKCWSLSNVKPKVGFNIIYSVYKIKPNLTFRLWSRYLRSWIKSHHLRITVYLTVSPNFIKLTNINQWDKK